MSAIKTKLKAARDAIGKKRYAEAKNAALQVLELEADNYMGNVFLGLACLELEETSESEQAFNKAIEISPEQSLALQGVAKLYERSQNWKRYTEALKQLADIFCKTQDATRCAETLQKLIECERDHGTPSQLVDVLSLFLPSSTLYSILSTLPEPDPTNPTSTTTFWAQTAVRDSFPIIEEIVSILEKEEETMFQREFDRRRTRLGARSDVVRKEVLSEILRHSKLPSFYNEILNHPQTTDDLRRTTEAKLLKHKQLLLQSLPTNTKAKEKLSKEVMDLFSGIVLLKIPNELAWTLSFDSKDVKNRDGYDHEAFVHFIELFPSSPLAAMLKGYLIYYGLPTSKVDTASTSLESAADDFEQASEVGYDMMLEAFPALPKSVIARMILARVYLQELDYANAIATATSGIQITTTFEESMGLRLENIHLAFQVIKATSLVHLFPPKHHKRAQALISSILAKVPNDFECLMSQGYISRDAQNWTEAVEAFSKAYSVCGDLSEGVRTQEEMAWALYHAGEKEEGVHKLQEVVQQLEIDDTRKSDCARCLWRLGKCFWDQNGQREEAYRAFIMSLKKDPAFSPAFTALGIYYLEAASPPDPTRASKCFQKSFELDPREGEAAQHLASGFAEEREWALVDVIARRTIEGEGGLDAGLEEIDESTIGRFLPTNAWAWKAVGIVEMTRHNYPEAIQHLQIALRAFPNDAMAWLRLGEAYGKSGKHSAAIKALEHVEMLQPGDWMCAYFLADVHRQMGHHQAAIDVLEETLIRQPSEVALQVLLAETQLEHGHTQAMDGFIERAEASFSSAIWVSLDAVETHPGYRGLLWKTVADSVFALSSRSTFAVGDIVQRSLSRLNSILVAESNQTSHVSGLINLRQNGIDIFKGIDALEIALIAYSHRLTLDLFSSSAMSAAWYDLANALQHWIRVILSDEQKQLGHKKVVHFLTEAVKKSPLNDSYWVALGDAYFMTSVKLAQHAYIRALEIDAKNLIAWANLGLLYLQYQDLQLANEALYKAQVINPDYTLAWVGQALVASANNHPSDAMRLFEHSVTLTTIVPIGDYQYSHRAFRAIQTKEFNSTESLTDNLLPIFFVLGRHCKGCPDDPSALHLYGLVCERLGILESALVFIGKAITLLEAKYEENEDPTTEWHFTVAQSNMARLKFSVQDYEGAIESFDSCLGLLSDEDTNEENIILRTQAHFGLGLAHFKLGDLQAALGCCTAALETAGDRIVIAGQVTVLLAQIMWAIGSDEFKESAKAQLLECISADPENLEAINCLAAMGILTDDDALVDAALSEILALPFDKRIEQDPGRDVGYLLIQHSLGQEDATKAMTIAQNAVVSEPTYHKARQELATLTLQSRTNEDVLSLLNDAPDLIHQAYGIRKTPSSLVLTAVAQTHEPEDNGAAMRLAQRAVMLSPWDRENWLTLAYTRGKTNENVNGEQC